MPTPRLPFASNLDEFSVAKASVTRSGGGDSSLPSGGDPLGGSGLGSESSDIRLNHAYVQHLR
jgi:hypothetical protein